LVSLDSPAKVPFTMHSFNLHRTGCPALGPIGVYPTVTVSRHERS